MPPLHRSRYRTDEPAFLDPTATDPVTPAEVARVLTDLTWLDRCICSRLQTRDFFVPAGHVLAPDVAQVARTCPSRRQEVIFAYAREIRWGYYGALSPGQRAKMTMDEAVQFIADDTATALQDAAATPEPAK